MYQQGWCTWSFQDGARDLAAAIGADTRLDPQLVEFAVREFAAQEDAYRLSGVIAARPPIPDGADAQTRLLAMFGRMAERSPVERARRRVRT